MTLLSVAGPVLTSFDGGTNDGWGEPGSDLERIRAMLKQDDARVWLFTGDSITQGAKHTYGQQNYAEIFEERLRWEMRRLRDVVINTAINGSNTSQLLGDFEWCAARWKPDVVSMMFGTNDCQAAEIPSEKFRANLEELVRKIRALGAIPLLQTPNAIGSESAVTAAHIKSRAALPEYVNIIKEVAEKGRLALVDHWTYWQGRGEAGENYLSWLDDPLHPNASGHREMARLIFKTLDIYDPRAFTCTGEKN